MEENAREANIHYPWKKGYELVHSHGPEVISYFGAVLLQRM